MKFCYPLAAVAAAAMMCASCGGHHGWSVDGTVDGAERGTALAVEAYNAGRWYVLDSVKTDGSGRFAYQAAEPMHGSDILRLTLPGKGSVYFPVDSVDAVSVEADASTFGTGHRLLGTALAQTVGAIDSLVAVTADVDQLRRALAGFVTSDTTGIIAYYAIGKSVGSTPVFNPNESFGNRIYGAAAQVYAHYRPEDPRGSVLREAYFAGRRALGKAVPGQNSQVIEVPETGIIEVARYDNKGTMRSLSELASQGKVVLLSFTDYSLQSSPAYNAVLNDLYTLYHSKGLEIYQIGFDGSEVEWKEAALNLPWITVWNSPEDGSSVLASYNVGALPLTYIIDRSGDLGKRIVDPTALPKEVARYF